MRHDAGAPPDLTQDALKRVVGANPPPMLRREGVVSECLLEAASTSSAALASRRPRSFSISRCAIALLTFSIDAGRPRYDRRCSAYTSERRPSAVEPKRKPAVIMSGVCWRDRGGTISRC